MNLDEMQTRLHELGVDVPKDTLKGWAYHKPPIIPPPERYKHGKGSGKKGRAVEWSEDALAEAAAAWAVKNNPRITKPTPLRLIPFIKRSAVFFYDSPTGSYELPQGRLKRDEGAITYKSIKTLFPYHPWYAMGGIGGIPPPQDEWTELVTTWIAATEKAREGKQIKDAYEIRFHWQSKESDVIKEGVDYTLEKVTLKKSESDHDELVIMIGGVDFRKQLVRILGYSNNL